jgi:hypothetical protein
MLQRPEQNLGRGLLGALRRTRKPGKEERGRGGALLDYPIVLLKIGEHREV